MILILLAAFIATNVQSKNIYQLDMGDYKISYNCKMRGYEMYEYTAHKDNGQLPRLRPFHQEQQLPKHCQQFTTGTYKLGIGKQSTSITYDLGHGAGQNHFDYSIDARYQSNSMANVVPQNSALNRTGLWRATDVAIECERDIGPVDVYGGVIWGTDSSNDHFIKSHGVTTPDYLWKVIQNSKGDVQAWIMPNKAIKKKEASKYFVSVAEIEKLTGYNLAKIKNKTSVAKQIWKASKYCNRG